MKYTPAYSLTLFLLALGFSSQSSHSQSLELSSFSLAANDGSDGYFENNLFFFDGIEGTPGIDFPAEPFGTLLYLRERFATELNRPERWVQANMVFDVSALTAPVSSATLDFSAYVINAFEDYQFSVSRLDADMAYDAESSLPQTGNAAVYGRLQAGEFSIDVTEIVNSWIAGAENRGFLVKFDVKVNDGFGIADDSDDTYQDENDVEVAATVPTLTLNGGGPGSRVVEFTVERVEEPANVFVTIEFTSVVDQDYSLFASSDFNDAIGDRIEVDDTIDGQAGTTEYMFDFNDRGLSLDAERLYFVVREND